MSLIKRDGEQYIEAQKLLELIGTSKDELVFVPAKFYLGVITLKANNLDHAKNYFEEIAKQTSHPVLKKKA